MKVLRDFFSMLGRQAKDKMETNSIIVIYEQFKQALDWADGDAFNNIKEI